MGAGMNKEAKVTERNDGEGFVSGGITNQDIQTRLDDGDMDDGGESETADRRVLTANWSRISQRLRAEYGEDVWTSWFQSIEVAELNNGTMFLSVPTKFLKSWITEHYRQRILKLWKLECDDVRSVEIVQRMPKAHRAERAVPEQASRASDGLGNRTSGFGPSAIEAGTDVLGDSMLGSPLDPRLTFQTYRTGKSNALAAAAARQVAGAEAGDQVQFNPLYVHSAVGRGKTHLLQAITSHVERHRPARRVLYLTAERFMGRFKEALQTDRALQFKDRLRGMDMLVIDDLQFLGKQFQQEFCHTLNSLLDGCRQVVVAADRPAADLDGLDERVRSRLAGGLTVEIGAPDHELRVEILRARVEAAARKYAGFEMPDEVLHIIAAQVKTNGRDLEGVFNRLLAHNQFGKMPITLDLAEKTVRGHVRAEEPRRIRIEDIQRAVANHFNVTKSDLLSARRNRSIVRPRQIAMYLSKQMTPRSLPEIGRRFGGRDHTTVLHAVRKIEELIGEDAAVARDVDVLKRFFEENG